MRLLLAAFALIWLFGTSVAQAQDDDAEARAVLAERFVDATVRSGLDKSLQRLVDAEGEDSPLSPEQRRWMSANMPDILKHHLSVMIDQTEVLYSERLTLAQLTALVGFYDTPQGREIAARQFDLGTEVGTQLTPMLQAFTTELLTKFCAQFDCPGQTAVQGAAKR